MSQKTLSLWLKGLLVLAGLFGLVLYGAVVPLAGQSFVAHYPEFQAAFWPWAIFLWITAVPCYTVLVLGWFIAAEIGQGRSFTLANARRLRQIAYYAGVDTLLLFTGNIVFLLLGWHHPSLFLFCLLIVLVGMMLAVAFAIVSHLVCKAAALQNETDLTI